MTDEGVGRDVSVAKEPHRARGLWPGPAPPSAPPGGTVIDLELGGNKGLQFKASQAKEHSLTLVFSAAFVQQSQETDSWLVATWAATAAHYVGTPGLSSLPLPPANSGEGPGCLKQSNLG